MSREPTRVQRGDAPNQSAVDALNRAKARARAQAVPGPMDTPRDFADPDTPKGIQPAPGHGTPPPRELSQDTVDGLEALARHHAAQSGYSAPVEPEEETPAAAEQTVPAEITREVIKEIFKVDERDAVRIEQIAFPDRDVSVMQAQRNVIESRLGVMDIGEYLMNGVLSQQVPIILGKLEVTFATVSDAVEVYVDSELAREASGDQMTQRQFSRRQNELALAAYVRRYNSKEWPALINPDGSVNKDSMAKRLANVRQISTPVYDLMVRNLGWFFERVRKSLDVAVLGNG